MKFNPCAIPGPLLIEPRVFEDARGFFMESWSAQVFAEAGINAGFVQDNHSCSHKGVLRGLHFQDPGPQGKLVRVTAGAVFDVAVDLRRGSPHFGQWIGAELSAVNRHILWIPRGFAHGFLALADGSELLYKCDAPYDAAAGQVLAWDDPDVAVEWPLGGAEPLLSDKDRAGMSLAEIAGAAC